MFLLGISALGPRANAHVATASTPQRVREGLRHRPTDILLANPSLWPWRRWEHLAEHSFDHPDCVVGIIVECVRDWEFERAVRGGYAAYLDRRFITELTFPGLVQTLASGGSVFLGANRCVDLPQLREREIEILQLLAEGVSVSDMADRLFLSERTVKAAIRSAVSALGARNRVQAVAMAATLGLLRPDSRCAADPSRPAI